MQKKEIAQRVHKYYWDLDLNCATTMLKILAEEYNVELHKQVIHSALGMHGAGKYRAQCGLVEGMLMFIGIYGSYLDYPENKIVDLCYDSASGFEKMFGSLVCKELRPEGFKPDNPPHLCEDLTIEAVKYAVDFISNRDIG